MLIDLFSATLKSNVRLLTKKRKAPPRLSFSTCQPRHQFILLARSYHVCSTRPTISRLFHLSDHLPFYPIYSTWPIVASLLHLPSHEYNRVGNNAGPITDPLYFQTNECELKIIKSKEGNDSIISLLVECSGIRRGWVMRAVRNFLLSIELATSLHRRETWNVKKLFRQISPDQFLFFQAVRENCK